LRRSCIALDLSASLAVPARMSFTETKRNVRSVACYWLSKWQNNPHFNICDHTSCDRVYNIFNIYICNSCDLLTIYLIESM
jgi:hypothetical protein